jgi:hypothetical protein
LLLILVLVLLLIVTGFWTFAVSGLFGADAAGFACGARDTVGDGLLLDPTGLVAGAALAGTAFTSGAFFAGDFGFWTGTFCTGAFCTGVFRTGGAGTLLGTALGAGLLATCDFVLGAALGCAFVVTLGAAFLAGTALPLGAGLRAGDLALAFPLTLPAIFPAIFPPDLPLALPAGALDFEAFPETTGFLLLPPAFGADLETTLATTLVFAFAFAFGVAFLTVVFTLAPDAAVIFIAISVSLPVLIFAITKKQYCFGWEASLATIVLLIRRPAHHPAT